MEVRYSLWHWQHDRAVKVQGRGNTASRPECPHRADEQTFREFEVRHGVIQSLYAHSTSISPARSSTYITASQLGYFSLSDIRPYIADLRTMNMRFCDSKGAKLKRCMIEHAFSVEAWADRRWEMTPPDTSYTRLREKAVSLLSGIQELDLMTYNGTISVMSMSLKPRLTTLRTAYVVAMTSRSG
jgi:hypothetical protein